MDADHISWYFYVGLLVVLAYLSFLMVEPFLRYIMMALILTYIMYPLYERLHAYLGNASLSSGLMLTVVLLVVIIPSVFIIKTLIGQATNALMSVKSVNLSDSGFLQRLGFDDAQIEQATRQVLNKLGDFVIDSASNVISSLPNVILGLFVLFFIMYYGFKEGPGLFRAIESHLPLKSGMKNKLLDEIHKVTHGVLYGQVLTAVIQGSVGGIGLLIFDVPNAVFWGFVMIVLCFFPVVGTPIVWGPAALFKLSANEYANGIGLLIYGSILAMNIDNVLRPKLISEHAQIHPVIVLVGVLGGLALFGFSGLVLGPLVMALLISMLRFYHSEEFAL